MKKLFIFLIIFTAISCNRNSPESSTKVITVSIAPFKYFVEKIGGNEFKVNVMVPTGANPHIYEPYPQQIIMLRKSIAYISNGYLGFELTWLDRFYEINRKMVKLSVGNNITTISSVHGLEGEHTEGTDPHYWVSPKSALIIASSVKDLLCELTPGEKQKYETNYDTLVSKINEVDEKAKSLFDGFHGRAFMIYHPNLAYLARDYGLEEVSVEFEGKEPPPSRLKELVDFAKTRNIKTIFVQREYDSKNAKAIAHEIGAEIRVIDPLSPDWMGATLDIINALYTSFIESEK